MAANPGPLTSIANALHPGAHKPTPKSTDMIHHPDGTHSVTTHMSDGTEHPNSGAVADVDGIHEKLHENLADGI